MISEILDNSGFNTLIYDDPYAKICLITSIILEFQNNTEYQKKIAYIDLDAAFTSYAKAGLIPFIEIEKIDDDIYQSQSGGLKIYLPSKDILDFIVRSEERRVGKECRCKL